MKKGYVYLICDAETNRYKIGMTKGTIKNRMKKLQTGNSCELHIANYHETFYPYCIENMLHKYFSNKNELNEWYNLSSEDVFNFKNLCNEMENRINTLKDNPFFKKSLH